MSNHFKKCRKSLLKNEVDKMLLINQLSSSLNHFINLSSEDAKLSIIIMEFCKYGDEENSIIVILLYHKYLRRQVNILVPKRREQDYVTNVVVPLNDTLLEE